MQFTPITSNIPLPPKRSCFNGTGFAALLAKLEVNQSFAIPASENQKSAQQNASAFAKRNNRKFTTRKLEDGSLRIWRIE